MTLFWIIVLVWALMSATAALIVGRTIRNRDTQQPRVQVRDGQTEDA